MYKYKDIRDDHPKKTKYPTIYLGIFRVKKKNTPALQQCNGIKACSNLSRHFWQEANKTGKQDHDL